MYFFLSGEGGSFQSFTKKKSSTLPLNLESGASPQSFINVVSSSDQKFPSGMEIQVSLLTMKIPRPRVALVSISSLDFLLGWDP